MDERDVRVVILDGELPAMNELIGKNRLSPYAGATLKKRATEEVKCAALLQGVGPVKKKVGVHCRWFCKNMRKDPDNTASAVKFILDGLVAAGVLENDGWKQIGDISHAFFVDKEAPRVEVGLYPFKEPEGFFVKKIRDFFRKFGGE